MTTITTLPVDPSNAEQLRAWNGDDGDFWALNTGTFDRSVAGYHTRFMQAAAIADTERVLDVGCGTGQATRDAARATPNGFALGVDLSAAMLDVARQLAAAEGVANARFEQADAQIHPFDRAGFDIAISRTGAMFFGDPVAAFTNIARAIRPGGRLALLTWQPVPRNEWFGSFIAALAAGRALPAPSPDTPNPFALADPDRIRTVLERSGFTRIRIDGVTSGMWFGRDAADAEQFVLGLLGWLLDGLDETGRNRAIDALRDTLAAHDTPEGVVYESAGWIIGAGRQ